MEDELDKTVSVFDQPVKKDYKLVICKKEGHEVINLNSFNKNEITFGRAKDNDIVIESNIVSGHHGKFVLTEGLKVVDNQSTNGLFINGTETLESTLSDGDTIKIDNPDTSLEQAVIITVILGEEPEKCPNCNKSLVEKEEFLEIEEDTKKESVEEKPKEEKQEPKDTTRCLKCGFELDNEQEFCPECGTKRGEINNKKCHKCGAVLEEDKKFCSKCGEKVKLDITETIKKIDVSEIKNKKNLQTFIIIGAIILFLLVCFFIKKNNDYNKLPIKVDYTMTSFDGYIDDILDELGLDFDLVTMGGNCYTGVQSATFETEKFGILHTEYRYCKSNETLSFRVYNTEKDQKLRDPKPGELAVFDKYGKRLSSSNSKI